MCVAAANKGQLDIWIRIGEAPQGIIWYKSSEINRIASPKKKIITCKCRCQGHIAGALRGVVTCVGPLHVLQHISKACMLP